MMKQYLATSLIIAGLCGMFTFATPNYSVLFYGEPTGLQNSVQSTSLYRNSNLDDSFTPLKILVITGVFPSLSQSFVQNQVVGLINQGHDVSIYARKTEMDKVHQNVSKYNLLDKFYCRKYPEDLASYDIILSQFATCSIGLVRLKRRKKLPAKLVTFFRGYDITQYAEKHPGCYNSLFANGDYFFSNSQHFKNVAAALGCDPNKIGVIFSTIDLDIFTYEPKTFDKESPIKLLSAGRLIEKKGIQDAIPAVARLIKENPAIEYTIAGDGPLKKKFEKQVKDLGIADNVTFTGAYTSREFAQLLRESHVFIGPSVTASDKNQDACPNVLKEAMAVGVPVVATRHGGIPEIIFHEVNGLLVEEHDIDGIESMIRTLINDSNLCKRLAKEGRKTVDQHFDINAVGKKLSDMLIEIHNFKS